MGMRKSINKESTRHEGEVMGKMRNGTVNWRIGGLVACGVVAVAAAIVIVGVVVVEVVDEARGYGR